MERDLTQKPVIAIFCQNAINGEYVFDSTLGPQTDESRLGFIKAKMQQRIIKFTVSLKGPV